AAVDPEPEVEGADQRQHQDRRDDRELDRGRARDRLVARGQERAQARAKEMADMLHDAHYSVSWAVDEPIGFVPEPLQLMAKFALPTKLTVSPTSCRQPLAEAAPPENDTLARGR